MKIAILVTEYLQSYLQQAVKDLDLECETEIFIYYNYIHIVDLYKQLQDRFDGFITTGPVPMQTIKKSVPNCKPISFFLCTDSNYYKTFFEVIYKYKDWNFEYGYFDFCDYLCPDNESELIKYLEDGSLNQWLDKNNEFMANMSIDEMQASTKKKLQKHIDLWNSGKIKYSLSRMSPIMPEILEAGVNCYYISFSYDDIKICFKQLTQSILVNQLKNHTPAIIYITIPQPDKSKSDSWDEFQTRLELLEKLILAFNKKFLCDFITRDSRYGFYIFSNHKCVEKITNSFTTCYLRKYITENGIPDVYIGYGLGNDLKQSEDNAIDANKESKISFNTDSYIITETRDQIGLFDNAQVFEIQNEITPYIMELAERTGLSTLTIQKLLSALRILNTNEVTTIDLSRVLHITVRSVNRILTHLVKFKLAQVIYSKQINTKGRPYKVYKLFLDYKC